MSSQRNFFDRYARGESSQPTTGYNQTSETYSNLPQTTSVISGQTYNQTSAFNSQSYSSGSNVVSQATSVYEVEGRREQREADKSAYLKWASELTNNVLLTGSNDYTRLSNLRDAILELKSQYFHPNSGLSVKGAESDQLNRRFLHIEHEVEGLLRRRIDLVTRNQITGQRDLDLAGVLTDKQNTIIELQKENENLRERLRLSNVARAELEAKIEKLTRELFEAKGLKGQALDNAVQREQNYAKTQRELATLRQTFASTIGIWQSQLQSYKSKFPNNNWQLDAQVTKYIQEYNIQPIQVNGYSVVELPTTRTRKWVRQNDIDEEFNLLIRKSFVEILHNYPNLKTSIDPRIISFIQTTAHYNDVRKYESGTIVRSNYDTTVDLLDEVSLNRLVEIVKFVPETVRVENIYTYSCSKAKKIEFHLRVLIKALLEQLEIAKAKYGAVLQIDQAVIGMINQEVLDIVSVDDILKVFRVKERIVEVEKIVEKVVEKIVEVPQVIPIEKYVEKIVEVPKYVEVEKIIHKPVEVVKVVDNIIEKFIQVPTIEQKIVEVPTERQVVVPLQKEVAKVVEVEKIVNQVVVDTKYVQIEKPVNHIVTETKALQVIKEVPIIQETVREVLKPVEFIVEKIVPVEVVKVEVVQVEKIVEKIIKEVVHVPVTSENLVIQEKLVEVPVYIEKLVPVETIVNKIVNVPQRIQVPVIVKETVQEIKTVQVIVQKIVQKIVPREVEKIKNVVVENVVEKIKTVEKKIEVPILQDRIVTVPIEVPKIVVERVHVPHVVPVKCIQEKIIEKPKVVQVEKPYIQYIKDVQVVNCVVEKIVQVPRTIERIKEVKVKVEKIVNKLVEVPKVVQVEKVVQKIVVVPRVIEKPIEVPQIVEVVVEKVVQVPTVKVVQKVVEKIVYVDKPVQVQKIRNVYLEVDRPVEKIKEIPVVAETVIEKKEVVQVPVEKIVTVAKEVPVQLLVDNVVEKVVECAKLIEVEKQELVVVEVPKVVDRYIEKAVQVRSTFVQHKEIHIPVQVPIREQTVKTNIVQVEKVIRQPVAVSEPKVYTETKVVVNEKFTPIKEEVKVPVVLPAQKPFVQPVVVDRFIEKPVEVVVEVRQEKAIHVENNIPVEVYRVVGLNNDRCLIGTEHKIVREVVDRIVPVPTYEQYAVQKDVEIEKIIQVKSVETKIKPEVQVVEKVVQKENFTTVKDKVPYYEQKVQVVDRFESTQVPAFTTQEKLVVVPEFQQKIYERIIVMPQIVEVVKYITEVCEAENPLIAGVHVDILQQEKQYKELYGVSKKQLEILLVELRKLRGTQPNLAGIIELVERYLIDFDRLASVQKIVPVEREKIVEKEVPKAVLVSRQDSETMRNQIAYSLLIEKLIVELKRIKKENNNIKLNLDNDLNLFFFNELQDQTNAGGNLQESLANYTKETLNKLNSLGGDWTHSHEVMLSTILAERFTMANLVKQANIQIEKAQAISVANANAIKNLENKWLPLQKSITEKRDALNRVLANNTTLRNNSELVNLVKEFDTLVAGSFVSFEPIKVIESTFTVGTGTNWNRAVSRIHELELANKALTEKLLEAEKRSLSRTSVDTTTQFTIAALKSENQRLVSQIDNLKRTASTASNNTQLQRDFEESQTKVRTLTSRVQELELQLKTANSRNSDLDSQIRTLNLRIQELDTQLRASKDVKSSAASENSQLVDSKYSSSSSSNVNITKTAYEVPSYASSSVYSVESSGTSELAGLSSSGVRGTSTITNYQTTSTYGTSGTGAYQSGSKLSNSGFQITNAGEPSNFSFSNNATKTTTNVTSGGYSSNYSISGLNNDYSATRFNTTTTGPSYGTSGISNQYGATNFTSSSSGSKGAYSNQVTSSLSGSGLRESGTGFSSSGQSGNSFASSNYTFQTKKF